MLKDFTIANLLDLNETIAKDLFEGKTYPWEVLPEIGDFIIKLGKTLDPSEYEEKSENVWIANYNCPGQLVITGEKSAVETAGSSLKEAGAKRVILLNVSGPFHSPMMETAGQQLARVLENVRLNQPVIPYVSNVTADFVGETGEIKDLLIRQVSSPVRWQQSVEKLIAAGVDTFVEIGPGKTLSGFIRRIDRNVKCFNVGTWEEAEKAAEQLC